MPELPKKKVGLVSCSGEEMAEGTVTRLATRKVLEALRPGETVTICLPLFLAGGEGDRAFARFHPTITIDGCERRCAAKGTERLSSRPAASVVVTELCEAPGGFGTARRLNEAGLNAVDQVAAEIVRDVDRLLAIPLNPPQTLFSLSVFQDSAAAASCSCGSGAQATYLEIPGRSVEVFALSQIFDRLRKAGRQPGPATSIELMENVRRFNRIPEDEQEYWREVIERKFAVYCEREGR